MSGDLKKCYVATGAGDADFWQTNRDSVTCTQLQIAASLEVMLR
jgi:hypothetical protein